MKIDSLLSELDSQITRLEAKDVIPKAIMLQEFNFYTLIGHIQKNPSEDFIVDLRNSANKSMITSSFYYKNLPVFYFQSAVASDAAITVLGSPKEF